MTPLSSLTRRNLLIAVHDALATTAAVLASFYLRFESDALLERLPVLVRILPFFVALSVVVCYLFNLTTTKWRFFSLPDAFNVLRAATVLTVALVALDYIFLAPNIYGAFFLGKVTIILYWFFQVFLLSASRFAYRYFRYTRTLHHARERNAAPALMVGRAADLEVLLRAIENGSVRAIWPVGLLSPSRADRGQLVRNIPVLGGLEDLQDVVRDFADRHWPIARLVMGASAFEADAHPERVLVQARKLGLVVSRLPSLDGEETPQLRPIAIEDLLLRATQAIDRSRIEQLVKGRAILVTGGAGSIGSEICERVILHGADRVLVIDNSEPALHSIIEALSTRFPQANVEGRIADVRDRSRIFQLLQEFKPDIVFHAAALKHVPLLERDWSEGVKTNVLGSINVADASVASSAQAMVLISTDKAIEPVSMLGLTKRFAEMYCQALDHDIRCSGSDTPRLISVRFGNVLASNGSVVPKFKAQIDAGGPVTVTHPDMLRYFMTIREACDLVITAASHAVASGNREASVYVLNMGQPVRIVDLAERMIRLSGLEPGRDIEIAFTGMRPGERLNEKLFAHEEPPVDIGIDGIMAAKPNQPSTLQVKRWLEALDRAAARVDRNAILAVLHEAIPEFGSDAA
ncbi:nucleoside-diphosphate sugar epimerase/dehydratase [Bradyrhizobium vignae]|uniref:polysaccharide biosynthesis protein n=1 Tax=Bradyrhizobium TaxID=374 RepID=UPI00100BE05B|nr:nucleoside-diphosphate sugar epimerase/dehydratase [Bradyrhizobium vignae]RXH01622.1 polysaccharide biosynthesis protein [Bradyrhizobium vignae]